MCARSIAREQAYMSDVSDDPPQRPSTRATLRSALPFGLVKRGRHVVGCWFTCNARLGSVMRDGVPVQSLAAFCHGMIKTEDGRVAGVQRLLRAQEDIGGQALMLLFQASCEDTPNMRRMVGGAFTNAVREANHLFDVTWTPERAAHEMAAVKRLDGHAGWRWDGDEQALLDDVRSFFVARQRVLRRFFDALDQDLVEALRPHSPYADDASELDALIGDVWPLLDRTFGGASSLRDRILPAIDDYDHVHASLHRLASYMAHEDRPPTCDEWQILRMRKFMPERTIDIANVTMPDPS